MEIRTQSGQVMYESEFRAYTLAHGGPTWTTTTAEILASLGAVVVLEGARPTSTRYQVVQRQGVEQIDGKWYTKYVLGPTFIDHVVDGVTKTAAQQESEYKAAKDAERASVVRKQRDDLLLGTDWKVIKAAETSTALAAEWATYRQALRDVTKQQGFPWEVQWPTKPNA